MLRLRSALVRAPRTDVVGFAMRDGVNTPARAALSCTRSYSRSSRREHDVSGWYGERLRATTILSVRKDDKVFVIGDGQVSLGSQVIKPNARKVRKLKEGVICGFAGATADAMTLFERLEMKLQVRDAPSRVMRLATSGRASNDRSVPHAGAP